VENYRISKKQKKRIMMFAFALTICGAYLGWLSLKELNDSFSAGAYVGCSGENSNGIC
jgi:hypothetical protein